jgi:hypothetical protein
MEKKRNKIYIELTLDDFLKPVIKEGSNSFLDHNKKPRRRR